MNIMFRVLNLSVSHGFGFTLSVSGVLVVSAILVLVIVSIIVIYLTISIISYDIIQHARKLICILQPRIC